MTMADPATAIQAHQRSKILEVLTDVTDWPVNWTDARRPYAKPQASGEVLVQHLDTRHLGPAESRLVWVPDMGVWNEVTIQQVVYTIRVQPESFVHADDRVAQELAARIVGRVQSRRRLAMFRDAGMSFHSINLSTNLSDVDGTAGDRVVSIVGVDLRLNAVRSEVVDTVVPIESLDVTGDTGSSADATVRIEGIES